MTKTLADRIEALDGPSREIDALIWCHLRGVKYKANNQAYNSEATQVEYTEPPKRTRLVSAGTESRPHAERYTASIDAAMTLVPDGWVVGSLEWWPMRNDAGIALLETKYSPPNQEWESHGYDSKYCSKAIARAVTPSLAICAAALRAREVQS